MGRKRPTADKTPGLTPGVFRVAMKDRLHIYQRSKDGQFIARSWPKGNGGDTPRRAAAREMFKKAVAAAKAANGDARGWARKITTQTTFLERDVLEMAAYGTLSLMTTQDGKVWMGFRVANEVINTLLDAIFNTPGTMLMRGPDNWLGIIAGSGGQVLTISPLTGFPQWLDGAGDIQALLDQVSTTPGMGVVRGAAQWEPVDLSDAGDVQALLNQLTPSTDSLAVFSGGAWSAVPYSTLFDAAGAASAAQAAAEAYADTLVGGIAQSFHPGFASALWYDTPHNSSPSTGLFSTGKIYTCPIYLPSSTTVNRLGFRTSSVASGKARMSIWSNVNGQPHALEYDQPVQTVTTSTFFQYTGVAKLLGEGWHHLGIAFDGSTNMETMTLQGMPSWLTGITDPSVEGNGISGSWTWSTGAQPSTFPTVSYNVTTSPRLVFGV